MSKFLRGVATGLNKSSELTVESIIAERRAVALAELGQKYNIQLEGIRNENDNARTKTTLDAQAAEGQKTRDAAKQLNDDDNATSKEVATIGANSRLAIAEGKNALYENGLMGRARGGSSGGDGGGDRKVKIRYSKVAGPDGSLSEVPSSVEITEGGNVINASYAEYLKTITPPPPTPEPTDIPDYLKVDQAALSRTRNATQLENTLLAPVRSTVGLLAQAKQSGVRFDNRAPMALSGVKY